MPLMEVEWFESWVRIRCELEKLASKTNIIEYDEYLNVCNKYGVFKDEADSLSQYLHDLGIILHFQDNLLLRNLIILNPDWGTSAVYKVLDAEDKLLKGRNGILYSTDLPKIWDDKDIYPEDKYPIILALMEKFQLSFTLENGKSFLVAELLENEEIESGFSYVDDNPLNFQYKYDFLPSGIMTRFIVKANNYLKELNNKKLCWKKGAHLKYRSASSIVKLYEGIKERKIEINVYGENVRDKQDLLRIIRMNFEEIHKTISKLNVTENIKCNCHPQCKYVHDYDYKYLIKLEQLNISYERCRESFNEVAVTKLLDGIEINRLSVKKGELLEMETPNIIIAPVNKIYNENNASNINTNSITITIEIRNQINELQGAINDLKDELVFENHADNDEIQKEFQKITTSMEKLDSAQNRDEVIASGALRKIPRFLENLNDESSKLGKALKNVKAGISIVQDVAERYNSIAEWCGMPVVPKVFLKNKE